MIGQSVSKSLTGSELPLHMPRVLLTKLLIKNLGPIDDDEIQIEPFTFFVGRNNTGKSHYVRAIELLLAPKLPEKDEVVKLQRDKTRPIEIEGHFAGVENFTALVTASNHKRAIEERIQGGVLKVVRTLDPAAEEGAGSNIGLRREDGSVYNPAGWTNNLLKILPDTIVIVATADTVEQLKSRGIESCIIQQ